MEDNKEVVLSPDGLKRVQEELDYLRTTKRKEVAERLKEARSHGDLSENSEYDDARNEQSFVEGRIAELEKIVRNARVIEETHHTSGMVELGSRVTLRDLEFDEELTYTLVGSVEADPSKNRISNESPVGRAILGQKVGAVVEVEAPAGTLKFEILSVD